MFVKPPIVMFCISQNTIMIINYFIRFTLLKLPRGEVYDMLMHLSPPQRFQSALHGALHDALHDAYRIEPLCGRHAGEKSTKPETSAEERAHALQGIF